MDWREVHANGNSFYFSEGNVATRHDRKGHHQNFFASDATVILGEDFSTITIPARKEATRVQWKLPFNYSLANTNQSVFLVIASRRQFAGLHTTKFNQAAEISVNGTGVERINLRIKPTDHSDYFHRAKLPEFLPPLLPYRDCQTVYAWPLETSILSKESVQLIEVSVEPGVNWDIDYLCIVYQCINHHRIFISYSSLDRKTANKVYKALRRAGISAWIDVVEILPGQSLISRISDAISNVDIVLALISINSVSSKWVKKELELAMTNEINGRELLVVPIRLDNCTIPNFLLDKLFIDLRRNQPYHNLVKEIEKLLRNEET